MSSQYWLSNKALGATVQNGLFVALSAQVALSRRLEAIANNVANLATPGYRATGVTFESALAGAGGGRIDYVTSGRDFISREPGGLVKTDNPLDLSIRGDGWFAISGDKGVVYTRDGRMGIAETGALQTLNGEAVLDAGGAPIVLDATAGTPTIASDGMINQGGRQVGAVGLFAIAESAKLTRAGTSGVVPDLPATPVLDFTRNGIIEGAIEGANINPVKEMTKLITVARAFEAVSAEVSQSESSLQDAIKTLSAG